MFYPGNAPQLDAEVAELLDGVENFEPRLGYPKALIVPHAGYVYSGPIAARAYDELAAARGLVKRVVLIGPSHYVAGRGLALPECDAFETPLGRIRLDAEAIATLADLKQVVRSSAAHAQEHSLEVQLPFLQKVLGRFFPRADRGGHGPHRGGDAGDRSGSGAGRRRCSSSAPTCRTTIPTTKRSASTARRSSASRLWRSTSTTRKPAAPRD